MIKEKWEHRGTARVRVSGEDIEKIFREGGSAWIVNWMSRLQKSAKLSEIKSESNVDGGPPTLILAFTVPHDPIEEKEANAQIDFIGSTERERARAIAIAAIEHVASWLGEDASGELEEDARDDDIIILGDDPAVEKLEAFCDAMSERTYRTIDKCFENVAKILETGGIRNTLADLAVEDICGSVDD